MREITFEDSKTIQLELLGKLHGYCEKNGLTYFLYYGTLLGAVRHHGYIPWDDDIDVCMPREDYEKFFASFEGENVKTFECKKDGEYYLPFGKLTDTRTCLKENMKNDLEIGVYIDVFPLDFLPENEKALSKQIKKQIFEKTLLNLFVCPGSDKRKGIRRIANSVLSFLLCPFLSMNGISQKIDENAARCSKGKKTSLVGAQTVVESDSLKKKHEAELFENRVLLPFEDKEFYAPAEYGKVLEQLYGDYMTLPPVSQRVAYHEYTQYWKE